MDEVGAVVEGYYAAAAGFELSKRLGIEMPIMEAAYSVLYGGADVNETFYRLMTRGKKHELEEYCGY
jgi:glycerol-3-phosphate dehydrogenase (NAD(P)+)